MANEQNKNQNTAFDAAKKSTETPNTQTEKQGDFGTTANSFSQTNQTEGKNASQQKGGSTEISVESAKETARGLYDSAKGVVGQAYGTATKRATEALDDRKTVVAEGLGTVAETIKQVGENLNTGDEPNKIAETAAQYTDTVARQIGNLSNYFERKDVREMVRDVETFARRYPAYFIGGAFALGFLASRFLKSANPKQLKSGAGRTFSEGYDTGKRLTSGDDSQTATNGY